MQIARPPGAARSELERLLLGLARHVQGQTEGADGAGVTVLLGEGSAFVGSNAFTERVDEVQYRLDQGPCLTAVAEGRVIRSQRIGTGERRWPDFTKRAAALELRSVVSAPIRAGDELIGSINLYSTAPDGFRAVGRSTLRRSTVEAERSLSGLRLLVLAEAGAQTLATAVQERRDADLAVGLLMDRYTMNANQADVLLTQLARYDGVPKVEAARALLDEDPS